MDPITLAITGALGSLGVKVINDAYTAFKAALQQKYGLDSDLVETVKKLEEKPDSKARQAMLQEEVETAKVNDDPNFHQLAQDLLDKLNSEQAQVSQVKVEISGGTVQGIVGSGKVDVETFNFDNSPDEK